MQKRKRRNRSEILRSDFESWLKDPITKFFIEFLANEEALYRQAAGEGRPVGDGTSAEAVGLAYLKMIWKADEYKKLRGGLGYHRIIPTEKREIEEHEGSDSITGTAVSTINTWSPITN